MNTNTLPQEDPIITWRAQKHFHRTRTKFWYIGAAVVCGLLLFYSLFTGAWSFLILTVVLIGLYWKLHDKEEEHEMSIWKTGFAIDSVFTEWKNCSGYWILQHKNQYELHIEKSVGGSVSILIEDIDPHLMHDLLPNLLPHLADRRESVLDTIIRICKI